MQAQPISTPAPPLFANDPLTQCQQLFADSLALRQHSRQLIRESRAISAQSESLRQWWQLYRKNRGRASAVEIDAKPERATIATARRVPWRRLQMEDIDGEVIEWTAPEYTQVFAQRV